CTQRKVIARWKISEPYRVGVSGSRYWDDYPLFEKRMNQMLHNLPHDKVHLIAGGAHSGADLHVRRYAKDYGFKYTTFPADWDGPYRKGAGFRRNEWMGDVITHLIAFWDFKSPGTKHMID